LDRRTERALTLRAPSGADEEALLDLAGHGARVRALLERCVVAPAGARVGALVAGDREAVLLHLRAITAGEHFGCSVSCPLCDEGMDLHMAVAELLLGPYPDPQPEHVATLPGGEVRFRLPTVDDLDAAAAASEPERELLARVVLAGEIATDADRESLAAELERLDPQAELRLTLTCVDCGAPVESVLDAAGLVLGELARSHDELARDVHALALHYHWSEDAILALDVPRRRRYLDLLADSLSAAGTLA
jgi:hypothetical protein